MTILASNHEKRPAETPLRIARMFQRLSRGNGPTGFLWHLMGIFEGMAR